jgi:hypothetical protein
MTLLINAAAIPLIALASPATVTDRAGYANIAPYLGGTLIYAHYELAGMNFLRADAKPVTIIQADGSTRQYRVIRQGVEDVTALPEYISPDTVTLFTCYPTLDNPDRRWIAELAEVHHDDSR